MKKTQIKLTIIFTSIIFFIILIFGVWFFSFKYYSELKEEYNTFVEWINYIKINEIESNDLINLDYLNIWKNQVSSVNSDVLSDFNYVYIDKKTRDISTNINKKIYDRDLLHYILEEDWINEIDYLWEYFVTKLESENWDFALLKRVEYDLEDYLWDLFFYFLVSIFSSVLLFIIWYKFVAKTLKPVKQNLEEMNNFIHNASHELKHPIAHINSNIEIINDEKIYNEELNSEIKNELFNMVKLINRLSDLSNLQNEKDKEICYIREIIDDSLIKYKKEISEKNIDLIIEIDDDFEIKANRYSLHILFSNLIWNAVKYNKNRGKIKIYSKKRKIFIEDTWIWIPKNDLKRIFERFYQVDKSRKSKWFWIWLSLVKKIIDINKWDIKVESKEDFYTKIVLDFS